jgi:hypothetical protein
VWSWSHFHGCVWWGGETLAGGGVTRPGFRARDSLSLAQTTGMVCGNGVPVESGARTGDSARQPSSPTRGKRAVRVGRTDRSARAPIRSVLLINRHAGCVHGDLHPLAACGSAYRVDRVRSIDETPAQLRPARRWCVVLMETIDHDPALIPHARAGASDPTAHAWFITPPHHVAHPRAGIRVTTGVPNPDVRGRHRQRQGAVAAGNGLTHQRRPHTGARLPPHSPDGMGVTAITGWALVSAHSPTCSHVIGSMSSAAQKLTMMPTGSHPPGTRTTRRIRGSSPTMATARTSGPGSGCSAGSHHG